MNKKTKITLLAILLGLIFINIIILKDVDLSKPSHKSLPFKNEKNAANDNAGAGKVQIGGDFELNDQNSQPFSSEKLKGKYSIIYFGFTHCPMVCPTALNNLTLAINEIGDKADDFNFVFITTDPERDTAERLKEFLPNFSDRIIGLTGTEAQLQKAYEGYKVYAQKVIVPDNPNYDMNHSSIIYIMDKNAKYEAHFSHESSFEEMAKKLKAL